MQEKHKKIIWFSILFTLIALITVTASVFGIIYFSMPKNLADFAYSLGNEKFAAHLYFKAYEKDGNIDYCYKALNLKIKIDDSKGVIEVYNAYVNDDNYVSYNEMLKIHNEGVNCSLLEKSAILNDFNYLENKYIGALIKTNKKSDAFARAVKNFANYEDFDLLNQGAYNFNYFVGDSSAFLKTYEGYDESLIEEMKSYFDNAYLLFEENTDTEDNLQKAYLIALGNRLMMVGQNINTIYDACDINEAQIVTNLEKMENINNVIKGLLKK